MELVIPLILVVLALALLFSTVKIVPQGREFTVERFGRYTRTLKPGISFLTPFVESVGRKINVMEQVLDVPRQEVITKDNVSVQVDAIVFVQVMDASAAAYRVDNLNFAITQLAQTNLRTWWAPWTSTRSCPSASRSTRACWPPSTTRRALGASRPRASRSRT
jgi:regulator of protease activity HflC (stomatin/prohibitin superfamily)